MFTHDAVRRAVARAHDAEVTRIARVEAGHNHSYRVALDDSRRLFLKVGTRVPEAFPAEPATMELVRRETDIPVPCVHATGEDPLGYPYAVYDFVADAGFDWVRELPADIAERVCREAGRNLADLHEVTFPEFGRIGVDGESLSVVDPRPIRGLIRASLDRQFEQLRGSPFEDLLPSLGELGEQLRMDIEAEAVIPRLVHGDYRMDNLRLDPSRDPATRAVLDWELPAASDRLWDVVVTLLMLTDGYGVDPDEGRRYRYAFWEGYGELQASDARWRCYELLGRLRIARHRAKELAGEPDHATTTRLEEHRTAFEELLAGESRYRR